MITLKISEIAFDEIINALQEHSKKWKKGMTSSDSPFSDDVIKTIQLQKKNQ